MSDITVDTLKRELSEIKSAVQNVGSDRSTLDYDKLAKAIASLTGSAKGNEPDRKGEPGVAFEGERVKGGRFDGRTSDDVMLTHAIMTAAARADKAFRGPSDELSRVTKALTATGAGTGDEYVPTSLANSLWNDMFLPSRVAGQFSRVPMPTDPFELPLGWGDLVWRKGSANTETTTSDPATAKVTMTSTELVTQVELSYNLDEDSIIAVVPTLRDLITRSGTEQIDRFIMNADATNAATGNINLDDADPADDSYYLTNGQDGLRHLVLRDNTAQSTDINAVLDDAKLRAGIGRLGKYVSDVDRLVMFVDPKTYIGMLGLSNVSTMNTFGPRATVLTGQLASYAGIPIVVTPSIGEAEDDGCVSTTAGNNDEGTIILAHRDMWRTGFRRELTLEVDRNIKARSTFLVASFRMALVARGTRSTATHTAGIHGIMRA